MYRRAKTDRGRSAALETEADKEARKAILFSIIAMILSILDKGNTKIAVVGIEIDVRDQYILNGTFCGLALFYGYCVFSTGMQLYSSGRPNEFLGIYRRVICWVRNSALKDRYHARLAKLVARFVAFIMTAINASMGFVIISVYLTGVSLTFNDFRKVIDLIYSRVF